MLGLAVMLAVMQSCSVRHCQTDITLCSMPNLEAVRLPASCGCLQLRMYRVFWFYHWCEYNVSLSLLYVTLFRNLSVSYLILALSSLQAAVTCLTATEAHA